MKKIRIDYLDKYLEKHLPSINKKFNMNAIDKNQFWNEFLEKVKNKYPNPKYISIYKARKQYNFFEPVLKSFAKKGLIRTRINDSGYSEFAEEDIVVFKDLRDTFSKLEEADLIKTGIVQDQKKYLIFDFKNNWKTVDEHKTDMLLEILSGLDPFFEIKPKN